MSRMAREIARHRPDWPAIPEKLDRAWSWMEEQGYGNVVADGYLLSPYGEQAGPAPIFRAGIGLEGWFEEESAGYARLLPIAEAAVDGSIIALWRGDEGQERVVELESEGAGYVIADNPSGLLALLAVGYDEINEITLGAPPFDPVSEDALAPLRAWVESEFDTPVPPEWPAVGDDEFSAWLDQQLDREEPAAEPAGDQGILVAGEVIALLSILGEPDNADVIARVRDLTGANLKEHLRSSRAALRSVGLEVRSDRHGVSTVWIRLTGRSIGSIVKTKAAAYPRPAALIEGLDETSTVEDTLTILGEPKHRGQEYLRYAVNGRYMHLEFDECLLAQVTLMIEAP